MRILPDTEKISAFFPFDWDEDFEIAPRLLNHRARKCLTYQKRHEVFMDARRGALPT